MDVALPFVQAGVPVLVEKPIASSLEEANRLLDAAERRGTLVATGHTERFNPAVAAALPLVSEPRFIEIHRLGTFPERSLDIDVIFDLMIHDLDLLLAVVRSEVVAIEAVGVNVLTPRADIANARLRFASGCIANVTASRISRDRVRKARFSRQSSYVSIDYAAQEVDVYRLVERRPADDPGRTARVTGEEPLKRELEDFVDAVRTQRRPGVSGSDGRDALALATRVAEAMAVNLTDTTHSLRRQLRAARATSRAAPRHRAFESTSLRASVSAGMQESMTDVASFESLMDRVNAGERLTAPEIAQLASTPDILPLGMLADAVRRQLHDTRVTYLRVASCALDESFTDTVLPAARELRLTGTPESLNVAVTAVRRRRRSPATASCRASRGPCVETLAQDDGTVSPRPRGAAPGRPRCTGAAAARRDGESGRCDRTRDGRRLRAVCGSPSTRRQPPNACACSCSPRELQQRLGSIQAINPLPLTLHAFRPTTGYDDVKMVAIARLAAPDIPTVQVDWRRYGPKLAQVALTFGADDLDGVTAVGRRRRRPPPGAARGGAPQHRGGRPHTRRARRPLRLVS